MSEDIIRTNPPINAMDFGVPPLFAERAENYARWAVQAEREACAKVCDAVAESANKAAVAGQYLIIRNGAEARRCSAAIRTQAADRLARHGIQLPDEDEEYGNPSFG